MKPDPAQLATLHAACFPKGWGAACFYDLLAQTGVFSVTAEHGFILCRVAVEEVEILTFCVDPLSRRRGEGRQLLALAMAKAVQNGARTMFLEVAVDNLAAIALYHQAGFTQVGKRSAYYREGGETCKDALVMRKELL